MDPCLTPHLLKSIMIYACLSASHDVLLVYKSRINLYKSVHEL
jgi:hypothetical protein